MMEDINLDAINHLNDDLRANDYHPFGQKQVRRTS